MDLRLALRRYGDLLLAGSLALLLTSEVLLWKRTNDSAAIPAALLSTLPLALRRRSPLVGFSLTAAGSFVLAYLTRDFDDSSLGVLVVFLVALYSLGRHTRGLEAGIGALFVLGLGQSLFAESITAVKLTASYKAVVTRYTGTPAKRAGC